jgi:hypothetical protein
VPARDEQRVPIRHRERIPEPDHPLALVEAAVGRDVAERAGAFRHASRAAFGSQRVMTSAVQSRVQAFGAPPGRHRPPGGPDGLADRAAVLPDPPGRGFAGGSFGRRRIPRPDPWLEPGGPDQGLPLGAVQLHCRPVQAVDGDVGQLVAEGFVEASARRVAKLRAEDDSAIGGTATRQCGGQTAAEYDGD